MGLEGSPVQTLGENSRPTASQFVTNKQLGKALKQVQEAVIQGVCEHMKVPDQQPRVERGCDYRPAPECGSQYPQGLAAP